MDNKKDNFKRIAEKRTNKIIESISKLHNLTNTSFYEYTDTEIEIMFRDIEQAVQRSKKILLKNNRKNNKVEV